MKKERDPKVLSVAILHLLQDRATVEFPQTTRAHPSWLVCVHLMPARVLLGYTSYFPLWVDGFLWQDAVVPVIQDRDLDVRSPVSLGRTPNDLVAEIETRLRAKMIETGYLPTSTF